MTRSVHTAVLRSEPSETDRTPLASSSGDRRWPTDQEILEATINTDYRT
jgi:hypothetical protein